MNTNEAPVRFDLSGSQNPPPFFNGSVQEQVIVSAGETVVVAGENIVAADVTFQKAEDEPQSAALDALSALDGLKSCSRCGRDESATVILTIVGTEKLCSDHL